MIPLSIRVIPDHSGHVQSGFLADQFSTLVEGCRLALRYKDIGVHTLDGVLACVDRQRL